MTTQAYIHRGRQTLVSLLARSREHWALRGAFWALAGLLAGAASLGNVPQPLALAMICALTPARAVCATLGAAAGAWCFWGRAGVQCAVWAVLGLGLSLTLGRRAARDGGRLLAAVAAFGVSAVGLVFQMAGWEDTAFPLYALRIALAGAGVWCFRRAARGEDVLFIWLAEGAAMLALAQVGAAPWLNLGLLAAGALAVGEALPALALCGIALDLAGVSRVSCAAALCIAYLLRQLPVRRKWVRGLLPAAGYAGLLLLSGSADVLGLPCLGLGGLLGAWLPLRRDAQPRRGETGMAQVRLELMAGCLDQTRQLLLQAAEPQTDIPALLTRTRERACGGCPHRKQCRDIQLPENILELSMLESPELGFPCKKPGRMRQELLRSREQLRTLRADRLRRAQYRDAVAQQYGFLGEFLRQQADDLPRRAELLHRRYQAEVGVCTAGKEAANGDKCLWFSGTRCRYYILLCDGMGTGLGAESEGQTAAQMLRQMLTAGFPAEYALRSVNSLCCLRSLAGAVTMDLAELCLDSGRVTLYKWGAAPSWVLRRTGLEKIGTAGPPPGLSVTQDRERVERLSLRRGEALILTSDGVDGEDVLRRLGIDPAEPPGEVAALLVEHGSAQVADDATAAVVRLRPTALATA